ncbi:DUF4176 domain-containing protein [Konateibacter massiliensis]|uniref:DUF4176 domain-containing protein n=1 Tax=Konateibacter massiliensis TaxID=2002841 RepID=UPI000C156A58|nr:DUF4176 domain-containing protein [Konateibacter massiliensis]
MENKTEFLPLGSIVRLNGSVKKVVVIARAIATKIENEVKYFEYGGCLYPEGLLGDMILYFNNEDIQRVEYKGYADEDDTVMIQNLNESIQKLGYKKGTPLELNKQKEATAQ